MTLYIGRMLPKIETRLAPVERFGAGLEDHAITSITRSLSLPEWQIETARYLSTTGLIQSNLTWRRAREFIHARLEAAHRTTAAVSTLRASEPIYSSMHSSWNTKNEIGSFLIAIVVWFSLRTGKVW